MTSGSMAPVTPRVSDLAYARFRAPNLDAMTRFGQDFGFRDFAGAGDAVIAFGSLRNFPVHVTEVGEAGFAGFGAFMSAEGLATLALRHGKTVERVGAPFNTLRLRLMDPDGFVVDLLAPEALALRAPDARPGWNEAGLHARENLRLDMPGRPSRVFRLGHVVLAVSDLETSRGWYEQNLGLRVSDYIVAPGGETLTGAFMRCSMGPRPVDHHSVFIAARGEARFLHAAYEVEDFNDLMVGHDHLKQSGAVHHWGVGRHILGNHIFDYWLDPFGHELEHWTDGDVLDESHPPGRHTIETLLGVQWGRRHRMFDGQGA